MPKACVLVIEDNSTLRRALIECLTVVGYGTLEAFSKEEALQYLSLDFDAVVCDYIDPGGVSFCSFAKRLAGKHDKNIPIILLTGFATMNGHPYSHAVLRKPFDFSILEKALLEALTSKAKDK